MPLVKAHRLDFENVSFSDVKENGNGGNTVYVNYKKGIFKLQTPVMRMPYNLSVYDKGDYPKYSIDVAFRDMDSDYRVSGFYENMKKLQETIIDHAFENKKDFFGKKAKTHKTRDTTEASFNSIIKVYIDKETDEANGRYPDTMKFKMPVRDGKPGFTVVDFDDNEIENPDLTTIFTKESKVQAILRCGGIWLINGNFGCTWNIEKIRVESATSVEGGAGGMNFIDDDDSQDEDDSEEESEDEDSE